MTPYQNRNAVFVNGMKRGGTNIVWNLLQSHPLLVSPILETGQLIFPRWAQKGRAGVTMRYIARLLTGAGFEPYIRLIDERLYRGKQRTLDDDDNGFKTELERYSREDIENARLVTKSVGEDIFLSPYLTSILEGSCSIGVVRNGYAVCEGWIRRGMSPDRAARKYRRETGEIVRQGKECHNSLVMKFEDCISDPFREFGRMVEFAGLDPSGIEKLRIKAKRLVNQDGEHNLKFGIEGKKIWVGRNQVPDYFDTSITWRQISRLKDDEKRTIQEIAGDVMGSCGYEP